MAQFQVTGFAVVTGGNGGIGREVGFTFAEAGARGVIFADLDLDAVQNTAKDSEALATNPAYKALAIKVDVTNAQSVQALFDFAIQHFGRVDYCIHAAGIAHEHVSMIDLPEDMYDNVMNVNAKGTFTVTRAAAKAMRDQSTLKVSLGRHGERDLGRGSIVTVASLQSEQAIRGHAAYVTSKHAMTGIMRSCAVECRPYCIRVNQLEPVWVRTPMFEWETQRMPSITGMIQKIVPNGRPLEPDEVASAALYLCSPAGSYLSGVGLEMDYSLSAGPIL